MKRINKRFKKTNNYLKCRKCLTTLMVVCVAFFAAFLLKSDHAKTYADRDDLSESYQDAIDKAKEEARVLEENQRAISEKLENLYAESADLTQFIEETDIKLTEISEILKTLDERIADCTAELEKTNNLLLETQMLELSQYEIMKKRIKYMYENGQKNMIDVFAGAVDLSQVLNQVEYRKKITEYDQKLFESYVETIHKIETTKAIQDLQLQTLKDQQSAQEDARNALQILADAKAEKFATLCREIGIDEELLFEYYEEIVVKKADIERLEQLENDRLAEIERIRIAQEKLDNSTELEDILWPFPASWRITCPYGYRGDIGVEGASEYHYGIDISGAGKYGDDGVIVAALAGQVIIARYSVTAGYYIRIRHENNLWTTYMHASELFVNEGDYVTRGQPIMQVGSTGVSSGPHLHFEIQIDGVRIDPTLYVNYDKQNYYAE